jgi:hypothetical protein
VRARSAAICSSRAEPEAVETIALGLRERLAFEVSVLRRLGRGGRLEVVRHGVFAGFLVLLGALLLAVGTAKSARSLSCAASIGPMPIAPVFSVELHAEQTSLAEPAEVNLFGRFSWGVCSGIGPKVALEARRPGGEFAPAAGVATYHRGTGMVCGIPPGTPIPNPIPTPDPRPGPTPVPCTIDWSSEVLAYVTRPTETTDYRLRVGPLVSKTVTIMVANPLPEAERCNEVTPALAKPLLQAVPERTRIKYGDTVRVRGTFAYELCGRLVHPQTLPGIESLRAGARFPDQPARHMFAGPVRDPDGDLVWEFAPVQTTSYRLHYAGEFGEFETRVEVAPRLELELEAGAGAQERVSVCVRAYASTALRGVTVTLQRRTAGSGWEPLRTLTLDRSLSAVAQVALGSSDVELRVRVPTTLRHASATSTPILVPGS